MATLIHSGEGGGGECGLFGRVTPFFLSFITSYGELLFFDDASVRWDVGMYACMYMHTYACCVWCMWSIRPHPN